MRSYPILEPAVKFQLFHRNLLWLSSLRWPHGIATLLKRYDLHFGQLADRGWTRVEFDNTESPKAHEELRIIFRWVAVRLEDDRRELTKTLAIWKRNLVVLDNLPPFDSLKNHLSPALKVANAVDVSHLPH